MAIDLSNYEDCATLNKWFQGNFPLGSLRILKQEHHIITDKDGNIIDELFVVQTGAFRDVNDLQPATMNVARGRQSEYPKHMARFYAEDATTSSYGRCIALLKATDKTATKDDMRKVENEPLKNNYGKSGNAQLIELALRKSFRDDAKSEGEPKAWSVGDAIETIPTKPQQQECSHGLMILKEGTAKTGKPYYGYVCSAPKPDQCEARWGKLTANGNWYFEGGE